MKINDLKEKLDNEFNKYYNVVLVNGPWGIGKTFYLNEYLKEKKHVYLSLFGLNSMEEVKYGLYYQLNKIFSFFKNIARTFSGQSIGLFAVTVPIPNFRFDIEKSIKKELKNENIILVIDDLERKSENISMRELLGFVEGISQIEGIKVIVVANEEQISDEKDKKIFGLFKEKVVNKTYNISKYSPEAVSDICWKLLNVDDICNIIDNVSFCDVIGDIISNHSIKNLRTLSKAILFSKIILSNIATDDMKINDIKEIIKISFAVVIENTDGLYFQNKDNESLELCILKSYFKENVFDSNRLVIIKAILAIYDDKNNDKNYSDIKSHYYIKYNISPQEKNIFYCSEQEVEQRLNNFVKNKILRIDKQIDINVWFKELNDLYPWAEKINKPKIFDEKKIYLAIDKYIKNVVINDSLYNMIDRTIPFHFSHNEMEKYYNYLKRKMSLHYFKELIKKINSSIDAGVYDAKIIREFFDSFRNTYVMTDELKKEVLKLVKSNKFFIPYINDEISEEQWHWCHIIWESVSYTDELTKKELLKVSKRIVKDYSIIGRYRISSLNKQYHIEVS